MPMLTYVATYRLRPCGLAKGEDGHATRLVSTRIADFCLHHAAARAERRRRTVAKAQGWPEARTELISVELVGEGLEGEARAQARIMTLGLAGGEDVAWRLVAAVPVDARAG
jgi:hypothetical protein